MGNRLLIICYSAKSNTVSPTIYQHWSQGFDKVSQIAKEQFITFIDRKGDVDYFCARLIGRLHNNKNDEALSLGVWNTAPAIVEAVLKQDKAILSDHSHGDEGIMVIDCDNFKIDRY